MDTRDHICELPTYGQYRPTSLDARGLGLPDQQDWRVAPLSVTRGSEALERANWDEMCAQLEEIDPDGADHEVHRFGHWGPGWYEIVIVRPDSACEYLAAEIMCALADYPVLSEERWSAYEHEEHEEGNCGSDCTFCNEDRA